MMDHFSFIYRNNIIYNLSDIVQSKYIAISYISFLTNYKITLALLWEYKWIEGNFLHGSIMVYIVVPISDEAPVFVISNLHINQILIIL